MVRRVATRTALLTAMGAAADSFSSYTAAKYVIWLLVQHCAHMQIAEGRLLQGWASKP
eukprot:SAG31_NODE_43772_length_265_cov_1.246988_1_plen_57_part_10